MRLFFILLLCMSAFNINAQDLKVMTYNIRYDSPSDAEKGYGWEGQRKEKVADLIRHYNPDLIGLQEAMKHQIDYLLEQLPGYAFVGVGRDDGTMTGEFSCIFYKKDRFELIEESTFWLSETPDKPSKAWDAALPRICTWAAFRDKENDDEKFYHFNTHFDHIGVQARINSARLITRKIEEIADGQSVVLTGDFNAMPEEETYKILKDNITDARKEAEHPYGPAGTFSGFDVVATDSLRQIDYIFIEDFEVVSFETITDFSGDKYPSDHLPLVVGLNIQ